MLKILFAVLITSAGLLNFTAGGLRAQELNSARVLSIEGQVEIRRQPSDRPQVQKIAFKVEDELKAGDMIVTGKTGRMVLGLIDGSQAIIAPQTTVIIKDLSRSPRTFFNVIRGKARIHIEKLGGQPNPYRVNTPTAVIAVRGTTFDVLAGEDETQVYLHEGEVEVTNLVAPERPVFLVAGQMTRVWMQRLPNQPTSFKAGRNDKSFRPFNSGRNNGIYRARRNDDSSRGDRRIAESGPRPDFGRGTGSPNGSRPAVNPRPPGPGPSGPGPSGPSPSGPSPSGPRSSNKKP